MSKNIGNYYLFNKSLVKKIFFGFSIISSLYFIERKYQIKKNFLNIIKEPVFEIINSKEVKGEGVNLIEYIFKDKRTKQRVLISLKEVIREKKFEDEFKVFIKAWFIRVIKDKEFLNQTKKTVIEILKSPEVTGDTANLLKFTANAEATKTNVSTVMKEIWLREDVLSKLSSLIENCSLKAIQSERTKSYFNVFAGDVFNDNEFRSVIYKKALDLFSDNNKYD